MSAGKEVEGVDSWVQCDGCKGWDLFEKCGLGTVFNKKKVSGVKYRCRVCKLDERFVQLEKGKVKLENRCAELEKGKVVDAKVAEGVLMLKEVSDRVAKLELRLEAMEECVKAKVQDVSVECQERSSELAVNEAEFERKLGEFGKEVVEMKNMVAACEVMVHDFKEVWPSASEAAEWVKVVGKGKGVKGKAVDNAAKVSVVVSSKGKAAAGVGNEVSSVVSREVSFADSIRAKPKGTVVVVGDSLVRGVGQKLEQNCHLFKCVSRGGAKIDNIIEEVGKLEVSEDRHIVVVCGTNEVKSEGSVVMLKKYERLIERCKEKNRVVTVVGIPSRYDINSTLESRRLGVNVMLKALCERSEVKFLDFECGMSRLAQDGLHFNGWGQEELVRKIFVHCRNFLI